MTREQLVEVVARALCEAQRHLPDDPTWENTCARDLYEQEAEAALAALEAAGMVVVPVKAVTNMLLHSTLNGPRVSLDFLTTQEAEQFMEPIQAARRL